MTKSEVLAGIMKKRSGKRVFAPIKPLVDMRWVQWPPTLDDCLSALRALGYSVAITVTASRDASEGDR